MSTTPPQKPAAGSSPEPDPPTPGFELQPYHYMAFACMLAGGLAFLAGLLCLTSNSLGFGAAAVKVLRRFLKTVALRQVLGIGGAMAFVSYGLTPLLKRLRRVTGAEGPFEQSSEAYMLREIKTPLNFLFAVAAASTLAENFLPQLIAIPKVGHCSLGCGEGG